ncbi:MAG: sodium-dependent transporter [Acidobacteriota bacterium]|nr:MAG: sodium-dependent transporter [Acidobacteriota bacterium]
MKHQSAERGAWGSKLGFVLAAAGSAIGLGNIWGFPTQTGLNGGAGFVLVYLVCVLLIGVPVMIAELTIGRRSKSDPVGAFKKLAPESAWKYLGGLGVLTGLVILSYYSVIAGWTLKYILMTVQGVFDTANTESVTQIFSGFTSDGYQTTVFHLLFMCITVWVVTGGIEGGIERVTKILMPVLLGLLLLLVIRSVTLPGAGAGIEFYLKPDFSKITFEVVLAALGQAFFSLSLGMGAMITYGSYLSEKEDLVSSAFYVSLSDLTIAFLAGFAIFPALFAVEGLSPDQGPGLIFIVLPNIFESIPFGQAFGVAFYILLAIAALTSSISLLEVVVAYFIDQRGWHRRKAAITVGIMAFLLGVPSALGEGAVPSLSGFLANADFLFGKLSLIIGGLLICIFLGWKWGIQKALAEIRSSNDSFSLAPVWTILIRFICPLAIAVILVDRLLSLFRA